MFDSVDFAARQGQASDVSSGAHATSADPVPGRPGTPPPLPGVAVGGDYTPEQWPDEVWADDVRLMRARNDAWGTAFWSLRYSDGRVADPRHELACCADLTRGVAGGGPWFLVGGCAVVRERRGV